LLVIPGRKTSSATSRRIPLHGGLGEPILLSLFDTSSPGHDGAVILRGAEIERFAVHLPLSADHAQLGWGGTRHAAALGLAERTDALCVVVSEERGTVSVASRGVLRELSRPQELANELHRLLQEASPEKQPEPLWRRFQGMWKEASASLLLAALLWVVFVPGSSVTAVTHRVPVLVENLPRGYVLEAVDPPEIEVTLEGRRRDAYLVNRANLGAARRPPRQARTAHLRDHARQPESPTFSHRRAWPRTACASRVHQKEGREAERAPPRWSKGSVRPAGGGAAPVELASRPRSGAARGGGGSPGSVGRRARPPERPGASARSRSNPVKQEPRSPTFALRLAATLFFVAVNGFFVSAEFALVKAQRTQLRERSQRSRRARVAHQIRSHLDMYLSACQLGITLASLILGWLAEPAVAELLLWAAGSAGLELDPAISGCLIALARVSVVTFLHATPVSGRGSGPSIGRVGRSRSPTAAALRHRLPPPSGRSTKRQPCFESPG
jgi:hypothetical protein